MLTEILVLIGVFLVVLIIASIFFKHQVDALMEDYVFDGLFSLSDNLVGGAGLIGLDFGDWLGALFIFSKERKVTGLFWALLAVWEATNFLPFSFIPGVGESIETITGLFPCVFLLRLFFAKFGDAENELHKLDELKSIAQENGIHVPGYDKKKMEKMIKEDNPIGALNKARHARSKMEKDISEHVKSKIGHAEREIDEISKRISESMTAEGLDVKIRDAKNLVEEAKKLNKRGEYRKAVSALKEARREIDSVV